METKNISICKGCGIEYNRDNVARIYGSESSVFLGNYHSAICYTLSTSRPSPLPASVGEPYEGRIKNIDKGMWVTGWNEKRVTHTNNEKKAEVFFDESEAESALYHLNDYFPDCFTLIDNSPKSLTRDEKLPPATTVGELPEQLEVKNGYRNEPKIYGGRQYLSEYEVVGKSGGLHLYAAIPADGAVEKRFAEELVKRYNDWPDLLKSSIELADKADQLQEQNRVLAEALQKVMKCIKGTSDLTKLGDMIYDIRYYIQSALNSLTK